MLTFEALIAEAEKRGMPRAKLRGVLREYLQVLMLGELRLLPSAQNYQFTGGTYLRLVHRIHRFSEDLDFYAQSLTAKTFEKDMHLLSKQLQAQGIQQSVTSEQGDRLHTANFSFLDIENAYGITKTSQRRNALRIKVECQIPLWKLKPEVHLIEGFGLQFALRCSQQAALVADKIDALFHKDRARHIYDLLYLLGQNISADAKILKSYGHTWPAATLIRNAMKRFTANDLKKMAEHFRPFLFQEQDIDLIVHAPQLFEQVLQRNSAA